MTACLFAVLSCPKQTPKAASDVSRSETSTRSRLRAEREAARLASSSRFLEADAYADGGSPFNNKSNDDKTAAAISQAENRLLSSDAKYQDKELVESFQTSDCLNASR